MNTAKNIYESMSEEDKEFIKFAIEREGKKKVKAKMEEPGFLEEFYKIKKRNEEKVKAYGLHRFIGE